MIKHRTAYIPDYKHSTPTHFNRPTQPLQEAEPLIAREPIQEDTPTTREPSPVDQLNPCTPCTREPTSPELTSLPEPKSWFFCFFEALGNSPHNGRDGSIESYLKELPAPISSFEPIGFCCDFTRDL